ncbi:hypothetical protein SNE40_005035 [Patella caerulea]|uniref:Ribonuclease H1 n=1 Tax=Patella caerulea TaxID=87958 RepID=A0AAN8K4A9_PATCE
MFYAVRVGRIPGIYSTWKECEAQVKGFPKPEYRKFPTEAEAEEFIGGGFSSSQNSQPEWSSSSSCSTPGGRGRGFTASTPGVLETMINMKASIQQLQQQVGMISQTLLHLTDGLTTLETSLNVTQSPNLSRNSNNGTPLKRSMSSTSEQPPSKVKKALTDAWVNNNFTGEPFEDDDGVEVYTDGACFNNGKNGACSGIGVFWGVNDKRNTSEKLAGRQTNNRAEIHAARVAIEQAKKRKIKNLILHTDSEFLINSITKWIKGWKRNGWILSSGKPVVNKDDFQELDEALKGINVKWVHVRGHCGIPGNEAADRLANEGAKKSLP